MLKYCLSLLVAKLRDTVIAMLPLRLALKVSHFAFVRLERLMDQKHQKFPRWLMGCEPRSTVTLLQTVPTATSYRILKNKCLIMSNRLLIYTDRYVNSYPCMHVLNNVIFIICTYFLSPFCLSAQSIIL